MSTRENARDHAQDHAQDSHAQAGGQEAGAAAPSPLRVLLLDDDPFMLSLLEDMLEDLSPQPGTLQVASATSASAALALLAEAPRDMLVCDLSMPDMDGIEFLRLVAESHYRGSVALLSGMDAGVLRAAERLAMAQGLTIVGAHKKPVAAAELGALLARARAQRPS